MAPASTKRQPSSSPWMGTTPVRAFAYEEAFSRNIGWVTEHEQERLRRKRVAIAGLGGVGGSHLVTLTRLGVGRFHVADMDVFELANFNRQAGASMASIGRAKVEVAAELAETINPEVSIRRFPEGIHAGNVGAFLEGVDVYVDGLDFFAVDARRMVFAECERRGIPAITAAPIGFGAALLVFLPGRMTFEEYFRLDGQVATEQAMRFLVGLCPAGLQRSYLVDPTRVDLSLRRGPSTSAACELCAGIASTEALKILLGRGTVIAAPHGVHFDAYRNQLVRTWRPWGNAHPIQRLVLGKMRRALPPLESASSAGRPAIESIVDMARWAPSGDNTQPWRFRIVSDEHFIVHGHDTRDRCVYDIDGRASQIAHGALLETIRIAATCHGLRCEIARALSYPERTPTFDVRFFPDDSVRADPLASVVRHRTTQRRPLSPRHLEASEKGALEAALPPGMRVVWLEGTDKLKTAWLLFRSAKARLTAPEAYEVHREVIGWDTASSTEKVPAPSIGLDPVSLRLMRWTMRSWERVSWVNRLGVGTIIPRVELDLLPGWACGAHFALVRDVRPETLDDFLDVGAALQRFWLTATRLGLQLQPELTPVIFGWYARQRRAMSVSPAAQARVEHTARAFATLLGAARADRTAFFGRIGRGHAARVRSMRRPLDELVEDERSPRP